MRYKRKFLGVVSILSLGFLFSASDFYPKKSECVSLMGDYETYKKMRRSVMEDESRVNPEDRKEYIINELSKIIKKIEKDLIVNKCGEKIFA